MELSLDLSLACESRTISELLGGEILQSKDGSKKITNLEDFVKRLEDEMRKIEAFKRELPLCMILVNDAITRLKEEIEQCSRLEDGTVVEELMKTNSRGNGSFTILKQTIDKKNWMSTAQLWSAETKLRSGEDHRFVPHNPIQPWIETSNSEGAFAAFNGNSCVTKTALRDDKEISKVPSLGLMAQAFELHHGNSTSQGQQQQRQNPRKQRRCWSPELHRRFVDALQQLGGPQVATPKQIREQMQVGGLTNDEVKSHLQKYRLHFRRISTSEDQCGDNNKFSKGNLSQSGSPQGPLYLGGSVNVLSNSVDTEEDDEQSDCHSWKGGIYSPATTIAGVV